jgi:hypothetical protein
MSIQMSVGDLRALGLQIDPDNPTQAIPAGPQAESFPDETWDLERLGSYAATSLNEADRLQRESIQLGRRSTVQIFRSGHALAIARQKVKSERWGEWGRWLAEHNIKRTTAWEAIQLYERAGYEEAIANLTPSQAKRRYGIGSPPRADTEESVESGNHREAIRPLYPSSESTSQIEDESDYEEPEDADLNDENAGCEVPDEPDVIARPPRTVRDMLIASSNLLLACVQRSDEIDAACGDILAEIEASVKQLRGKVVS